MSKILTGKEMLEIVSGIVTGELKLAETPQDEEYLHFFNSLAEIITDFCGGTHKYPDYIDDELGHTVSFNIDDYVPDDGGVYAKYDTDVVWQNGIETDKPVTLESFPETVVTNCVSCENCRKCGSTICGNDVENLSCWEG